MTGKFTNTVERGWLQGMQRDLILSVGKKSRSAIDRVIAKYSTVGNPTFFEADVFSWTAALLANVEAVRKEAIDLLSQRVDLPPIQEIAPDHSRLSKDDRWKAFFLHGYGYPVEENCRRCPETARLVAQIPGLQTAFYSILAPGKRLIPHRGVTKAIVTCHLPLILPDQPENCWIRVDGERRHWQADRLLIFDDTYTHEVHNETDQKRVVLLLHVRRPTRYLGSLVGGAFLSAVRASPFVQDARKNLKAWEKRYGAQLDRP